MNIFIGADFAEQRQDTGLDERRFTAAGVAVDEQKITTVGALVAQAGEAVGDGA